MTDDHGLWPDASRYYVLGLLIVINVLSFVARHMLPAFATQITTDLDMSRQQLVPIAKATMLRRCRLVQDVQDQQLQQGQVQRQRQRSVDCEQLR